jgi:hypothetical protein
MPLIFSLSGALIFITKPPPLQPYNIRAKYISKLKGANFFKFYLNHLTPTLRSIT